MIPSDKRVPWGLETNAKYLAASIACSVFVLSLSAGFLIIAGWAAMSGMVTGGQRIAAIAVPLLVALLLLGLVFYVCLIDVDCVRPYGLSIYIVTIPILITLAILSFFAGALSIGAHANYPAFVTLISFATVFLLVLVWWIIHLRYSSDMTFISTGAFRPSSPKIGMAAPPMAPVAAPMMLEHVYYRPPDRIEDWVNHQSEYGRPPANPFTGYYY